MSDHIVAFILDQNFETVGLLDEYVSLVWTDRYNECGEFEVIVPASYPYKEAIVEDNLIYIRQSTRLMVIEKILYSSDIDEGDRITISGRSMECLLERRVIWDYTRLSGNLENGIRTLIFNNAVTPSNSNRKIPKLKFKESGSSFINGKTVDAEYHGENLLDVVSELCQTNDVGFKIIPDYNKKELTFQLYSGNDYSYSQDSLPWVVFSEMYENILDSRYLKSKVNYKNAVLILGDGEGSSRANVEVTEGSFSGINRREMSANTTATRANVEEPQYSEADEDATDQEKQQIEYHNSELRKMYQQQLSQADSIYKNEMKQDGQNELKKVSTTTFFDGVIDANIQFHYDEDFHLGDLVQVMNSYKMESKSRITEVQISDDVDGLRIIPSFTSLEKDTLIQ